MRNIMDQKIFTLHDYNASSTEFDRSLPWKDNQLKPLPVAQQTGEKWSSIAVRDAADESYLQDVFHSSHTNRYHRSHHHLYSLHHHHQHKLNLNVTKVNSMQNMSNVNQENSSFSPNNVDSVYPQDEVSEKYLPWRVWNPVDVEICLSPPHDSHVETDNPCISTSSFEAISFLPGSKEIETEMKPDVNGIHTDLKYFPNSRKLSFFSSHLSQNPHHSETEFPHHPSLLSHNHSQTNSWRLAVPHSGSSKPPSVLKDTENEGLYKNYNEKIISWFSKTESVNSSSDTSVDLAQTMDKEHQIHSLSHEVDCVCLEDIEEMEDVFDARDFENKRKSVLFSQSVSNS